MQPVNYLPVSRREPDWQYKMILQDIIDGLESETYNSAHDEPSQTILTPPAMKFRLRNGVPLITERSMSGIWKSAVGELLAFINGVHTLEGLREFGVSDRFWDRWVTAEKCAKRGLPPGDLGPGSYGPAFHDFPTPEGPFNQVKHLVDQVKELPHLRSHRMVNWIPQYQVRGAGKQQRVVVTPCHGDVFVRVRGRNLNLVMVQHKADMVVGVPNNMIQYAAFMLALAHVTGLTADTYHHVLIDAHVYLDKIAADSKTLMPQIDAAREITNRETRPFPKLELTPDAPDDIFKFRTEHFVLSEYNPHPAIKGIGTAI